MILRFNLESIDHAKLYSQKISFTIFRTPWSLPLEMFRGIKRTLGAVADLPHLGRNWDILPAVRKISIPSLDVNYGQNTQCFLKLQRFRVFQFWPKYTNTCISQNMRNEKKTKRSLYDGMGYYMRRKVSRVFCLSTIIHRHYHNHCDCPSS